MHSRSSPVEIVVRTPGDNIDRSGNTPVVDTITSIATMKRIACVAESSGDQYVNSTLKCPDCHKALMCYGKHIYEDSLLLSYLVRCNGTQFALQIDNVAQRYYRPKLFQTRSRHHRSDQ